MSHTYLDQGWAWVTLFGAHGFMFISGVAFSLGVYVAELIIELALDRPRVALFGSLQLAMLYGSGPMSYVSEKTSHRVVLFVASLVAAISTVASIFIKSLPALFITFGIIPGFCAGILVVQGIVLMNRYFHKFAGIANCLALAGCASGTLVLPPAFRANIEQYGWRSSLYFVAGIYLQGCVLAMVMRPLKQPNTIQIDVNIKIRNKTGLFSSPVYEKPSFYIYIMSMFLWCFCWPVVFVFAPTLFYEYGLAGWQIDILMSVLGASNLIIRLVFAFLSTFVEWNMILVHILSLIMLAGALVLFVVKPSLTLFIIASVIFGTSFGCTNCTQSLVARYIGDDHHYHIVYSASFVACLFGCVFGPFIAGLIYNATLNYTVAFLSFAGLSIISATVMSLVFCFKSPTPVSVKPKESQILIDDPED